MFSEVPDNAEHGKKELARLMLNPIQTHERMTDDGMSVTGPVDIETSVRCFETALQRLQTAREEVGVFCDNQILTDTQFEDAQRWLREACFEKYFMRNQDLVTVTLSQICIPDLSCRECTKNENRDFS